MKVRRRNPVLVVLLLVVAVTLRFVLFRSNGSGRIVASGTVEATEAELGFQQPGRIDSIAVREGDRVQGGTELAWLDRAELQARRRAAQAQADAARASLTELERGFRTEEVAQGRARLRAAEQRRNDTERDQERTRRLFEGGAVSQQAMDDAGSAYALAQAEYDDAKEALRITEEMREIVTAAHPHFRVPALDERGTPVGIDVRRVVETGVTPLINTGIAGRKAGTGQIGAGVARAPIACFTQALEALLQATGGPEMAPRNPRRSERAGEAGRAPR